MHASYFQIKRRGFVLAVFFCLAASLPEAWAQAPSKSVIFCSYNLKNWLLMQRSFGDADAPLTSKPEKEKAKVMEILTSIRPDILGVCEIGSLEDLKEIQARLRKEGLDLPHLEYCTGGDPTRSLGLLSRFPITARQSQTRLRYQMGESHLPMQRGILDATVTLSPDVQIRFVGVHLKSKRDVPEEDESLMRRNEAHLLRLHLDRIFNEDPQARVVAYGDFNEHRNEPAIGEIIGSRAGPGLMTDLHLEDEHGLVWTHFWDDADVYGRLDYIFVSRGLRPLVEMKGSYIQSSPDFDKASDHRAIVMRLNPQRKGSARKK